MENRKSLIYIASNGRSGSTLLGLLLHGLNNVWEVGETTVLFFDLIVKQYGCGCGKKLDECDFWASVLKNFQNNIKVIKNVAFFRDSLKGRKIIRLGHLFNIFLKKSPSKRKLLPFCESNYDFFSAVDKNAEHIKNKSIKYIVDNSKDFYRLFYFTKCSNFNIKALHIVKDPRAFVYSVVRHKKINFWTLLIKTIRMSLRYDAENFLIEKVCKSLPKNSVFFLRYEDLVSDPQFYMMKICDWLDIKENFDYSAQNFKNCVNHVVGPNKIEGDIVFQEKWKTNLPKFNKFLVVLITYFFAKRYGYFK